MNEDNGRLRLLHLASFLESLFVPEIRNWQRAESKATQSPSRLLRKIRFALRRAQVANQRGELRQAPWPGDSYHENEKDYAAAGLFTAFHWLLLGGALSYFPRSMTLKTLSPHFKLLEKHYGDFLLRCDKLFPEELVQPLRQVVQGRMPTSGSSSYIRRPQVLQPFLQTALVLAVGFNRDPLVQSFVRMLGFSKDNDWDALVNVRVRADRVAWVLVGNSQRVGKAGVYASFIRFVQYRLAYERVFQDLALSDAEVNSEDSELFIRLLNQTQLCRFNGWEPRTRLRLENFVENTQSWFERHHKQLQLHYYDFLSERRLGRPPPRVYRELRPCLCDSGSRPELGSQILAGLFSRRYRLRWKSSLKGTRVGHKGPPRNRPI